MKHPAHVTNFVWLTEYTPCSMPWKRVAGVIVMAWVMRDIVIIEQDTTDKPLMDGLVRAGVPREQIMLTYVGESLPDA